MLIASSGKVKKLRMMPKLVNKAFSEKSTQIMCLERHKEPYNTAKLDSQTRYVAASVVTDKQTNQLP